MADAVKQAAAADAAERQGEKYRSAGASSKDMVETEAQAFARVTQPTTPMGAGPAAAFGGSGSLSENFACRESNVERMAHSLGKSVSIVGDKEK